MKITKEQLEGLLAHMTEKGKKFAEDIDNMSRDYLLTNDLIQNINKKYKGHKATYRKCAKRFIKGLVSGYKEYYAKKDKETVEASNETNS